MEPRLMAIEMLAAARERVRAGWCAGATARDVAGGECDWESPTALAWCPVGALALEYSARRHDRAAWSAYGWAVNALPVDTPRRSDAGGGPAVAVELFDEAIMALSRAA